MKYMLIRRSQVLLRQNYRAVRIVRLRSVTKVNPVFRPVNRFGSKPQLVNVS